MNEIERIRKLLADTKAGEKGWRKALASAEGSHSRSLAEKNLSRLSDLRQTLVDQLESMDLPQRSEVKAASRRGRGAADLSGNVTVPRFSHG